MSLPRRSSLVCFLLALLAAASARADVLKQRAELYRAYGEQLNKLAASCVEQGDADAADVIKAWLPKRQPNQLTLFLIDESKPVPDSKADEELPTEKDSPAAKWRDEWQSLRNAQATALFELARKAVGEDRSSLAYELVVEAVRENPNHEAGRKMLGYSRTRNGKSWQTAYEAKQSKANKINHERFGWLPKSQVARYEKGERFAFGRWMPAAEEAEVRRSIARGWKVESEHFLVTTNHSLEEGVLLSRRLESLYDIWQQVFVPYLATEAELLKRFDGKLPRRDARPHNVVYYRNRQEYNDALRAAQPRIDMTLGIYFDTTRTAHFFAGDDQSTGTLYHEATHQLFQESKLVAPHVARDANFWVIEGIACYMESLTEHDGYYTLGGDNAGRVPAARHRLLEDNFYVPLARLVSLGRDQLQQDADIAKIYTQSAGLSNFFMHAREEQYRDRLSRYLSAVYAGRAAATALEEEMGQGYGTLDTEYRAFMSEMPEGSEASATEPTASSR